MKQPRSIRARAWFAAVIVGAVFTVAPAYAVTPVTAQDSIVAVSLASIATRGELASLHWSNLADVDADLQRAYLPRRWAPLWSRNGQVTPAARALLAALTRVADRGLDPADYDIARLTALAQAPLVDTDRRAEFDMTLSVASLRVLRGLYFGRVSATEMVPTLHVTRDSVDVAAAMGDVATGARPDSVLDAAEPSFATYRYLKRALASYESRASVDTIARARATQIAITMERWRWLPRDLGTPPVIVNIPAYELEAWAPGGDSAALHMDVIVGNTDAHQTPIFADSIRYVEFAPYWNVPLSIAKAELLPLAMRDPHILTVNNYEIVNQRGQVIVPTARSLKMVLAGTAFIRQLPGGSNALGRVKFMFPNTFDVYLHDSPVQADFARARRDQSHGCIRIADPRGMVMWLLRDQWDWDVARIDAAMNQRTTLRVNLLHPVPVYLFYATAVAQADGGVRFHDDIYGYDAALAAQLARGYPYRATVLEAGIADPGSHR